MGIALLVTLPLGVGALGPMIAHPALLVPATAIAVLSSAVPFVFELAALKRLPGRAFGLLTSLDPAVAALAGFAFLGEALGPARWIGLARITAASIGTVLLWQRAAAACHAPAPPAAPRFARRAPGARPVRTLDGRGPVWDLAAPTGPSP